MLESKHAELDIISYWYVNIRTSSDFQVSDAPYWMIAVMAASLTLIPAWIGNHMSRKVLDEITYPFLNFNGATVKV